jgi:hypothetical protein
MGRFDFKTRTGQISTIIQTLSGFSDADAEAFFARVTTAGGTLTSTEQVAINQLVLDMKTAGIWNSMKAIYPMVGASAAACAQNLKSSSFTGTFSSGWTFASTGVTPNGTSAFMETNFNPRNDTTGFNQHLSMYSRTQNTIVSGVQMGAYDNVSEMNIFQYFSALSLKGSSFYSYPTTAVTSNNSNTRGLQITSRTANNMVKLFFNGSLLNTNTTTETLTRPNISVYIGASRWVSGPNQYTPHQNAFSSIGDGLTDTQASDLYTAVQAFQTSLSRQV